MDNTNCEPNYEYVESKKKDRCDRCTSKAIKTKNGNSLCETHFREYMVLNS